MRALLAIAIVLAVGCEAVDNFDNFTFEKKNGGDLGVADLALAAFGGACTSNGCAQYGNGPLPTMCEQTVAGGSFPDGMCTRPCLPAAGCAEYPSAVCAPVFNGAYCVPRCSGTAGCRAGYTCCTKNGLNGVCIPSSEC